MILADNCLETILPNKTGPDHQISIEIFVVP